MIQSQSFFNHEVVHFETTRPARRSGARRPLAALMVIVAALASGLVAGQLTPSHPQPAAQPQPFDHFPR